MFPKFLLNSYGFNRLIMPDVEIFKSDLKMFLLFQTLETEAEEESLLKKKRITF